MSEENYSDKYSEESFWQKVGKFALVAGKKVIEIALTLYYCLKDPDTPKRAKATITGALGYFIWPLDAIPDLSWDTAMTSVHSCSLWLLWRRTSKPSIAGEPRTSSRSGLVKSKATTM